MQKLIKISQQTIWQSLVKLATSLSTFIVIGAIARVYGESGTGSFTLALTYLAFFYIISDFSFNAHVLVKIQDKEKEETEWRKLLGTRIIWSVFLMALAAAVILAIPQSLGFSPEFRMTALVGLLGILLYGVKVTCHVYFQAKLRYQYDLPPTLLATTLGAFAVIFLTSQKVPIFVNMIGFLLAWSVHSLGLLIVVRRFISINPIFDPAYIRRIFAEVWPMAATLVLNVVYFRVDAFILSFFQPSSHVGVYNVAYQVFQAVLVLPTFIMNSYYPMMLENLKSNLSKFFYQTKLAALALFLVAILISAELFIFSPLIVKAITGSGFAGSVNSLQILSFGIPAYFLSALALWVMVARKMYRPMLWIYLAGLLVNIYLNILFIPSHSYLAASWVTNVSEYLILMMQLVVIWIRR